MLSLICLFRPCKWVYIGNGLYQCIRCKTISMGTNRDDTNKRKSFFLVKIIATAYIDGLKKQGFDFNKEYLVNEVRVDGSIAIKIYNEYDIYTTYVFALGEYERVNKNKCHIYNNTKDCSFEHDCEFCKINRDEEIKGE